MIHDRPSVTDALGFQQVVDGLANVIAASTRDQMPFTVGLYGPWGSGKSTFVELLVQSLEKIGLTTIYFDAWKYDKRFDLVSALVGLLALRIESDGKGHPLAQSLREVVTRFSRSLTLSTGVVSMSFEQLLASESSLNTIDDLIDNFGKAVTALVGEEGKLVFVIDDLDRCLPQNAITVLESLKLFFDDDRCVFVLAVDRGALMASIDAQYGESGTQRGRDYLDKIVQVPLNIPTPSDEDVWLMVAEHMAPLGVRSDEQTTIIHAAVAGNPRRMIRIANSLEAVRVLQKVDGFEHQVPFYLTLWLTVVKVRFPDFYEFAAANNADLAAFMTMAQSNSPRDALANELTNRGTKTWVQWLDDIELHDFIKATLAAFGAEHPFFKTTNEQYRNAFGLVRFAD